MAQKTQIQYIGQFYVYGNAAPKAAEKPKHKKLPLLKFHPQAEKEQVLYLEPVALLGMAAALVLAVVMVLSLLTLRSDWEQYQATSKHLSALKRDNYVSARRYRSGYDIAEIQDKALGIGMVDIQEANHISLRVSMPEQPEELGFFQNLLLSWKELWTPLDADAVIVTAPEK